MEILDTIRQLNHALVAGLKKSLLDFESPQLCALANGSVRCWHPEQRWYRAGADEVRALAASASGSASATGGLVASAQPSIPASASGSASATGGLVASAQPSSASGLQEVAIVQGSASATGGPLASALHFIGEPELPSIALDCPMLLLSVDQKQSQWSACHFLADPAGLGLLVMFRGDKFHRSWRDFMWAVRTAAGHLDHTACQMNFAFNVNYQPFGSGGHLATKREMKLEWEQLFPRPGPQFEVMAHRVSLDQRLLASEAVNVIQTYDRHVLDTEAYVQKGEFMKQSSWFSILKLIDRHDTRWHCHKFMAEQVADKLLRSGSKSKKVMGDMAKALVPHAASDSGNQKEGKEGQLAELRKLRKKAGNAILMTPLLMNDNNLVNCRVMLLVGRPAFRRWQMQRNTRTFYCFRLRTAFIRS